QGRELLPAPRSIGNDQRHLACDADGSPARALDSPRGSGAQIGVPRRARSGPPGQEVSRIQPSGDKLMARILHHEKHFTSSNFVRDVVIGMSDGLTVPFALAAGLSGAISNTRFIVIGGLAEIAAGSIAMGLGGYLAARGEAEHYARERAREYREIKEIPEEEKAEVSRVFHNYGLTAQESATVVEALSQRPDAWVDFMMRFELGLEEPDPKRALTSAGTIAAAYVAGGFIPLSPYVVLSHAYQGLVF